MCVVTNSQDSIDNFYWLVNPKTTKRWKVTNRVATCKNRNVDTTFWVQYGKCNKTSIFCEVFCVTTCFIRILRENGETVFLVFFFPCTQSWSIEFSSLLSVFWWNRVDKKSLKRWKETGDGNKYIYIVLLHVFTYKQIPF